MNFIKDYISKHGYSPTVREIAKGVCLSSTSSIHRYMHRLKDKGLINFVDGQSRTITIKGG